MPTLQQLQKAAVIAAKIEELEKELQAVLTGGSVTSGKAAAGAKRRGRPPGNKAAAVVVEDATPKKRGPKPGSKRGPKKGSKRVLSDEARAKIAEAQKRRWAKTK